MLGPPAYGRRAGYDLARTIESRVDTFTGCHQLALAKAIASTKPRDISQSLDALAEDPALEALHDEINKPFEYPSGKHIFDMLNLLGRACAP